MGGLYRLAVIDDDAAVRQALIWLLEGQGYAVEGFESGEVFFEAPAQAVFNALIVDLRLSGMTGLMLLERLAERPYVPPAIMLTAHGDVPHAVAAFKRGVLDFLEKPFDDDRLIQLVAEAVERDRQARERHAHRARIRQGLALLTEREREVMQWILAGRLNKQIAEELSISMKTVEVHRARVFEKMNVKSAVELAGLMAGWQTDDMAGKP
ncbi:two component transcriptional regulator, LuxR family [Gulbenkiania indica]|uniref:Two component transcriptional regulator, LuxR family n=2 Tax=Gulbenkiania TaxID=397456 RepID=A0A0K6GV02_9NEIS|nr:response regulator [Gulbenkiania indica]TCW34006.1 two-component system response regulator DctR [Gulbenkiania mobilis]CUA82379.1 two component transcriptional regulator, LuxR family [Gulbenkiania indica]